MSFQHCVLILALLWVSPQALFAQSSDDKREIKPDLTYRSATLERNYKSAYHAPKRDRNYVDQLYLGLKFSRTVDYTHRFVVEPIVRTKRENPDDWDLEHLVDQAYVESDLGAGFVITAGKKTEYRGSGLFVNPSDLTNEDKDLYDSLYQREGKIFTRVSWGSGLWNIGAAFIPKRARNVEEGKGWLLVSGNALGIDMIVQGLYSGDSIAPNTANNEENQETDELKLYELGSAGLSLSRFFGEHVELHFDGRYQQRQRSHTEFVERKFATTYNRTDSSAYYLVGSRLVFTPRRTLVTEYFTNQSGLLNDEFDAYLEDVRASSSEELPPSHPLKRHYAFASFQDDDSIRNFHFGLSYLMGLDDESQFVSAQVRYALSKATSIEWAPLIFAGKLGSEYGEMPFKSIGYVTLRGSF